MTIANIVARAIRLGAIGTYEVECGRLVFDANENLVSLSHITYNPECETFTGWNGPVCEWETK